MIIFICHVHILFEVIVCDLKHLFQLEFGKQWLPNSLYRNLALPSLSSLGIAQASLALLSLNRDFTLLKDGDFIQWNIRSQLILQAIDVDELAVELFLVLMQLHKLVFPLRLVLLHAPF